MNYAPGFEDELSFWYAAPFSTSTIKIYDDVEARGNMVASILLPKTDNNGDPDPTGTFSPFFFVRIPFLVTARSVSFEGASNQLAVDDVILGKDSSNSCNSKGPSSKRKSKSKPKTAFQTSRGSETFNAVNAASYSSSSSSTTKHLLF
jgi:hypothetical protein